MQHMTNVFLLKVKKGLATGLALGSIVVIIHRNAVRPKKSSTPNHRLAPHGGEVSPSSDPSEHKISSGSPLVPSEGFSPKHKTPKVFIRSRDEGNPSGSKPMLTFNPDPIRRTFLLPPEANGERQSQGYQESCGNH